MKPNRVYIQQFGAFWSLSPSQWKQLVNVAKTGAEFNLDDAYKRIGKPSCVLRGDSGYWSASGLHPLKNILSWEVDDWEMEADQISDWA